MTGMGEGSDSSGRIQSIVIFGTGLIGTSIGLALKAAGFDRRISGWDKDPKQLQIALERNAIDQTIRETDVIRSAQAADLVVLATPVFGILDWMEQLAPHLNSKQLVTDVGSTKQAIAAKSAELFGNTSSAEFLPGHPMAGKEDHGAGHASAELFRNAAWLFTPIAAETNRTREWRSWVERMGARPVDLDAKEHDAICAWVSHLPQMVSTALAATLEDCFPADADAFGIGGRALREMTRLGASPFSMWRDIAISNDEAIAKSLLAMEQRLALIRESLKSPLLREEFELANRFRKKLSP